MAKKILRIIYYWFPSVAWMGIIFYFSSRSRISITKTYPTDFFIFKGLHMIEYATLYFLLFRSFYSIKSKRMSLQMKFIYPLIIAILYAASDEFHQTFISTREGRFRDVVIDTGGIVLMYIYIKNQLDFVKKFL